MVHRFIEQETFAITTRDLERPSVLLSVALELPVFGVCKSRIKEFGFLSLERTEQGIIG